MKEHNKRTFAKEYCLCRRIPYKFKGEQLILGKDKKTVIYSIYNIPYSEIVSTIDKCVEDDGYIY